MINVIDLAMKHICLKKASMTGGGEWQGPCPGCGGNDRFHVWPADNDGNGGYWCRQCGKTGDAIQFLRDFERMSFREACERLQIEIHRRAETGNVEQPVRPPRPEYAPAPRHLPQEIWMEKAERFVSWASAELAKNEDALAFLAARGIDRAAAEAHRLGWNPGERGSDIYRPRKSWGIPEEKKADGRPRALWIPRGLAIPCVIDGAVHRLRIRRPEGEPRYYVLPGSSAATYISGPDRRAFVVVESELDAITVASACGLTGAVAVGSVAGKPDAEAHAVLKRSLCILNALDYDAAGAKAMSWWASAFDRCVRWPVPRGKDPGEAYALGIDLEQWIKAGLPPALTVGEGGEAEKGGSKSDKAAKGGEKPHRTAQEGLKPAGTGNDPTPVSNGPEIGRIVPPAVRELHGLLRQNPGVVIINTPSRLTVLRRGKWVGGRIAELVFRVPEVAEFLLEHPAKEIDGRNFFMTSQDGN